MRKIKPRTLDIFCGAGGFSEGFRQAGYEIVAGIDNDPEALHAYKNNFGAEKGILWDLNKIKALTKEKDKEYLFKNIDVIIGGPPCQDFSSAGARNPNSKRSNLVNSFYILIKIIIPQYFVFENVPRVIHSKVYKDIKTKLSQKGYGLTELIVDAAFFGVPQTRKRLFLIGGLKKKEDFLKNLFISKRTEKPLSLKKFFHGKNNAKFYFRIPTNYGKRAVFSFDYPCTTIRGVDRPIPKNYKLHPKDPVETLQDVRLFTLRERALIQTFPSSYILNGSKTCLNRLVGNAVPVKLAKSIAESILENENTPQ